LAVVNCFVSNSIYDLLAQPPVFTHPRFFVTHSNDINNTLERHGAQIVVNEAFISINFNNVELVDSVSIINTPETWFSDGTAEGTVKNAYYLSSTHTQLDTTVLYVGQNGSLYRTNGTPETTHLVYQSDQFNVVYDLIRIGTGAIARVVHDSLGHVQLWFSNGTTEGTHLVKDLSEPDGGYPHTLIPAGDRAVFKLYNWGGEGNDIWITDGTTENTGSMVDFNQFHDEPLSLRIYRNRLYYIADNYTYGKTIHYLELEPNPNITGRAYHDWNENGQWEPDEPGIPNLPIIADDGSSTITYTREDGTYQFSMPDSTAYELRYLDQSHCWVLTSSPGYYEVELNDTSYQDLNFGFRKLQGAETAYLDIQSGLPDVVLPCHSGLMFIIPAVNP